MSEITGMLNRAQSLLIAIQRHVNADNYPGALGAAESLETCAAGLATAVSLEDMHRRLAELPPPHISEPVTAAELGDA